MIDISSDFPPEKSNHDRQSDEAERILGKTVHDQYRASNPFGSAWVSANAGSGKTHVLAQRVIRLLLSGATPSKILCLTFTRAAAAEMSNRVFKQLGKWSRLDDKTLKEELLHCGEKQISGHRLRTARRLFAKALESPGGLKIYTIHAFCEALLHQFTLESNTSGHFRVMGDSEHRAILEDARLEVLSNTSGQPELTEALEKAARYGSDRAIEEGLEGIINNSRDFLDWIGCNDVSVNRAITAFGEFIGIDANESESSMTGNLLSSLPIKEDALMEIGHAASHLDSKECQRVSGIIHSFGQEHSSVKKFGLRLELYRTKDNKKFRDRPPGNKSLYEIMPNFRRLFKSEMDAIRPAFDYYQNWKMLDGSSGLFVLADAILQTYGHRKKTLGQLDYDDLIHRAADLLSRSDVRQWVQYKLDQGIDHVLVDEAQDTSPVQWQIINAITEEFLVDRTVGKTLFVVGDQKQSIFSFRGADPAMFSQKREELNKKARDSQTPFEKIRLPASFRSTPDVLGAVDEVFSNPLNAKGLEGNRDPIIHEAMRQSDPGEVVIWPKIELQPKARQEDWLKPVDHIHKERPAIQLANQITETIKQWIRQDNTLSGNRKKISCGDILVLVRKRDYFVNAITRKLKQAGLEVAGADRLNLTEHIAIEDLLSLARWALFPEDDLALAETLKSPLFSLDEDDLFSICIERGKNSLWQSLQEHAEKEGNLLLKKVKEELERMRILAQTVPVYEFFSETLSSGSGRKKLRARLGEEVDDILDAFLLEALNHDANGGYGLQDFVYSLKISSPDVKREFDGKRNEIRIMTMHSAKGLEAPIVFLVDQGSPPYDPRHRPAVIKADYNALHPAFLWQPTKDDESEYTSLIYRQVQEKAEEEYRRLLYVGMTRAKDRLVICGYENRNSAQNVTWHDMVKNSLIEKSEQILSEGKIRAWRWTKSGKLRESSHKTEKLQEKNPLAEFDRLPSWISPFSDQDTERAPFLFPSTAAIARNGRKNGITEETGSIPRNHPDDFTLQKGIATHYLLQFLPKLKHSLRYERALAYLEKTCRNWNRGERDQVIRGILGILEDNRFRKLFSSCGQSEVSLTGILDPGGLDHRVSGKIDRLVISDSKVTVIDYKTDRLIPEKIKDQYLVQLAIYRVLTQQIYPDKHVECALLWISGPKISMIPTALLSMHLDIWIREEKRRKEIVTDA